MDASLSNMENSLGSSKFGSGSGNAASACDAVASDGPSSPLASFIAHPPPTLPPPAARPASPQCRADGTIPRRAGGAGCVDVAAVADGGESDVLAEVRPFYSTTAAQLKAQGNCAFSQGRYATALECYCSALEERAAPGVLAAVLYSSCALCLIKLGRPSEALVSAEQGLMHASSPGVVSALRWRRATALEALHRYSEAMKEFARVDPNRQFGTTEKLRRLSFLTTPRFDESIEADIAAHVRRASRAFIDARTAVDAGATNDEWISQDEHSFADCAFKFVTKTTFPTQLEVAGFLKCRCRMMPQGPQKTGGDLGYHHAVAQDIFACFSLLPGGALEAALRRQGHRLGQRALLELHYAVFMNRESPMYAKQDMSEYPFVMDYITDALGGAWGGIDGFRGDLVPDGPEHLSSLLGGSPLYASLSQLGMSGSQVPHGSQSRMTGTSNGRGGEESSSLSTSMGRALASPPVQPLHTSSLSLSGAFNRSRGPSGELSSHRALSQGQGGGSSVGAGDGSGSGDSSSMALIPPRPPTSLPLS